MAFAFVEYFCEKVAHIPITCEKNSHQMVLNLPTYSMLTITIVPIHIGLTFYGRKEVYNKIEWVRGKTVQVQIWPFKKNYARCIN